MKSALTKILILLTLTLPGSCRSTLIPAQGAENSAPSIEGRIFVDQNNPACSNSQSIEVARDQDSPFCSLRGLANKTLKAGDDVLIKAGDYDLSEGGLLDYFYILGDSTETDPRPKFIRPYPGDKVIIRAGDVCVENCDNSDLEDDLYSSSYLIYFKNIRNLKISNIDFRGHIALENNPNKILSRTRLLQVFRSDGFELRNSKFTGFEPSGDSDIALNKRKRDYRGQSKDGRDIMMRGAQGVYLHSSKNFLIENNTFDCISKPNLVEPTNQSKGHGLDVARSTKGIISGNEFGSCGHSSLRIGVSSHLKIEHNRFRNMVHSSVTSFRAKNLTFRNNIFEDENKYPSEPSYSSLSVSLGASRNCRIYNNLFIGGNHYSGGVALSVNTGSSYDSNEIKSIGNWIFNNSFYNKGSYSISLHDKQGMRPGKTVEARLLGNKVFNNVIVNTQANSYKEPGTGNGRKGLLHLIPFDFIQKRLVSGKVKTVASESQRVIPNFGNEGNEIFNNLIFQENIDADGVCNNKDAIRWGQSGRTALSESASDLNARPFAWNNICDPPEFVNPSSRDFSLLASSPARGMGRCNIIGFPPDALKDRSSIVRNPENCDIGAFQYSGNK